MAQLDFDLVDWKQTIQPPSHHRTICLISNRNNLLILIVPSTGYCTVQCSGVPCRQCCTDTSPLSLTMYNITIHWH